MVAPGRRGAEAGHLHQSTDLQHTTSLLTAARRLTPAEIKLYNNNHKNNLTSDITDLFSVILSGFCVPGVIQYILHLYF